MSAQRFRLFEAAIGHVDGMVDPEIARTSYQFYQSKLFDHESRFIQKQQRLNPGLSPLHWGSHPRIQPTLPSYWSLEPTQAIVEVRRTGTSSTSYLRRVGGRLLIEAVLSVEEDRTVVRSLQSDGAYLEHSTEFTGEQLKNQSPRGISIHPVEANALLYPEVFIAERTLVSSEPTRSKIFDRDATIETYRRIVSLDQSEILDGGRNPRVFKEAELIKLVRDSLTDVILEWRAVFGGRPYHVQRFSSLVFDP